MSAPSGQWCDRTVRRPALRGGPAPPRRSVVRPAAPLALLVLVALLPAAAAEGGLQDATAPRPLVQAGFIVKFPLFVTWPDEPWQREGTPFVIGVNGETEVRRHLDDLAQVATIEGSRFVVRDVATPEEAARCHLVFLAPGRDEGPEELLAELADRPVLTVADSEGLAARGVHINFLTGGEYVRFEINQRAAERAGLGLSFRLIDVARRVD